MGEGENGGGEDVKLAGTETRYPQPETWNLKPETLEPQVQFLDSAIPRMLI